MMLLMAVPMMLWVTIRTIWTTRRRLVRGRDGTIRVDGLTCLWLTVQAIMCMLSLLLNTGVGHRSAVMRM